MTPRNAGHRKPGSRPLPRRLRAVPFLGRAACLALLALAACEGPSTYDSRKHFDRKYFPTPPTRSGLRTVEWREIFFWTTDPSHKESVGFVETGEVTVEGEFDTKTIHLVYDRNQRAPFGYVNDIGVTRVWRHGGVRGESYWDRIGEYRLEDGIKALFKRGMKTNVGLERLEWTPRLD